MKIKKFYFLLLIIFVSVLFLPFNTYATQMLWSPYDIVLQQPGDNNVILSPHSYSLNNTNYWSFPPNQSSDFSTPASIYFRYNNGNSDYCVYQANNGSISGQFYAANAFNANHSVKIQDRSVSSRPYFNCSSTLNSNNHYLEFTCNNVNLAHNYNFIITNANAQRYGIRSYFNVECQQTIEGATQEIKGAIQEQTQVNKDIKNNTKETNDLLKDDNVDGANSTGSSFFNNFSGNNHGLSGIVSSPLRLINSLSSSTCTPLSFTIPFVNTQMTLPCMSTIYSTHFSTILTLYRLITTGLIAYKILINLFGTVKGLQDPDSSKIEVVDL